MTTFSFFTSSSCLKYIFFIDEINKRKLSFSLSCWTVNFYFSFSNIQKWWLFKTLWESHSEHKKTPCWMLFCLLLTLDCLWKQNEFFSFLLAKSRTKPQNDDYSLKIFATCDYLKNEQYFFIFYNQDLWRFSFFCYFLKFPSTTQFLFFKESSLNTVHQVFFNTFWLPPVVNEKNNTLKI